MLTGKCEPILPKMNLERIRAACELLRRNPWTPALLECSSTVLPRTLQQMRAFAISREIANARHQQRGNPVQSTRAAPRRKFASSSAPTALLPYLPGPARPVYCAAHTACKTIPYCASQLPSRRKEGCGKYYKNILKGAFLSQKTI